MSFFEDNEVKGHAIDVQFYVSQSAVLAHNLLYIAEKPGGASFNHEFSDTKTEHFFAGASSLFPPIFELSKRGVLIAQNHMWFDDAELGLFIAKGIEYSKRWYFSDGNTILGTIIMFSPIALAASYFFANEGMKTNVPLNLDVITELAEQFLKYSCTQDCVDLTKALSEHVSTRVLPSDKPEDDFNSFLRIHEFENTNLFEFTKFYENRDLVFYELSHKYNITQNVGLVTFLRSYDETNSFRESITQTFVTLLAEKKDTHIAKRFGNEIATEVREKARGIIENGGIFTKVGKKAINELDHYMRTSQRRNINAGTTADITATVIFLALLMGYRP